MQEYYKYEVTKYLNEFKEAFIFENKVIELFYTLFDFSNQNNVKLFLNKVSDLFKNINLKDDQKVCQFNDINNVFNQSFLYNCDISDRITFLAFRHSLDKKDKVCALLLKTQKDIQKLINYKIIGAKDFALQKEATKFLLCQTNEGIEGTYNILSENADKIKDGPIILAKILVNHIKFPIDKVQLYNKLSANLLNSTGKYNLELIDSYTKNAISLIKDMGELNTEQIEQQNNITIVTIINAYWNRASYYIKVDNNVEAIKCHLQYLKLIKKQDIWNYVNEIKLIINTIINNPIFATEIDQIFDILSTKQDDENLNQTLDQRRELFNNIVKDKVTRNNVQDYLDQINKLHTIKSIDLAVCKNILENMLDAFVAQTDPKFAMLFNTSYLNLSYEEGRKHFSLDAQDSTDLVQAVIFFIKHQKIQLAAEYLGRAEARYESMKQTCRELNTAFSKLHLELALNFISQDIHSHKYNIKKHFALAKKLTPNLNIDLYYLALNIQLGEINKEEIQRNPEIQDLVDEETSKCIVDNRLQQPNTLPTVLKPVTDEVTIYQRAAHKFYQEQKRKLDNYFNLKEQDYFSWKIGDKVYSTKNSEIVDLGYGKYCVIDDKLKDLQQYESYKKAMEKGYVNKLFDKNGVKRVGSTYEVKICTQDGRLHNNNVCYINPEGKKLIIFVKQANHSDIKRLFSTPIENIMVDSDYLSKHQENGEPQQTLDIYPDYDPNDFVLDCLGEEQGF